MTRFLAEALAGALLLLLALALCRMSRERVPEVFVLASDPYLDTLTGGDR